MRSGGAENRVSSTLACTNSSAVLMEGFLSKKEKAAKANKRLMMKFGKQRWRVNLYLADIL